MAVHAPTVAAGAASRRSGGPCATPSAAGDRREKLNTVLSSLAGALRPLSALAAAAPGRAGLSTGEAALDRALGGGLSRGAVSEFSGPVATVGLSGLQRQLLRSAREAQVFAALIDGFDRFDVETCPPELRASLLWVRGSGGVAQALKAADLLTHDPNFGLLLLDLREADRRALRRVPAQQWYRLQRTVRENDLILLAFTPFPTIPSATTRVAFRPAGGGRRQEAGGQRQDLQWTVLRSPALGTEAPRIAAM